MTEPYCIEEVLNTIKQKLIDAQNEMFSKTYFGPFLYLTKFNPLPQILHNLVYKIVNVPCSAEEDIYFEI